MSTHPRPVALGSAIAFVVGLTIAGCSPPSGGDVNTLSPEPGETATLPPPSPAETAATPVATSPGLPMDIQTEVEIPASDGLTLRGTFTPGQDADGAAVLLLHMFGSDRSSWGPFAELIAQSRISSLALDLRGHGTTGGVEDWELARSDVAEAFNWLRGLPGVDPDRVAIAGASIGANLSLVQAAEYPDDVAAVALLSPGLDYFRVQIDGLAGRLGSMPLFLAAAHDDGYSAATVTALAAESSGTPVVEVFDGAAHGTDLFFAHPESADKLQRFLQEALGG